ncbi:hypothetical protein Y032_0011g1440 [Ancylostoma ceylanicum]|nr:hypothetical protein Y032_0011g1440 [Ancylostoma ceylanicum]
MYCHPIVWFHEVINDTETVLTSLFNEIGIPLSCVPDAVQCKNRDSQEGSFLSSQNLTHIKANQRSAWAKDLHGNSRIMNEYQFERAAQSAKLKIAIVTVVEKNTSHTEYVQAMGS